jgi:hypothetical protein
MMAVLKNPALKSYGHAGKKLSVSWFLSNTATVKS